MIVIIVVAGIAVYLAATSGTGKSTTSSTQSTTTTVNAPSFITIGTLYASTGSYAQSSMPEYQGLELWANQVNQNGGIYVSSFGTKIPVKIISYDDASDPTTAANDYTQLITVNHVDLLVADFGSVLTAPAISIAQANKVLLWDVSGSSYSFFNSSNSYVVLTSLPRSDYFVPNVAPQLLSLGITKVAIIYAENDFTGYQAPFIVKGLAAGGVTPLMDQGYSTSTTDFSSLIASIQALHPQAVIELGYPPNDIAFLNQLGSMNVHFNYTYTNFPGQELSSFASSVGANLNGTFTLAYPPIIQYSPNYGLSLSDFQSAWQSTYPSTPVSFPAIMGYNTGLVMQAAIEHAGNLSGTALRNAAVNDLSGKLTTLDGTFIIEPSTGAQIGETPPVGQIWYHSNGTATATIVYPTNESTGAVVYPAPG